MAVSDNIVKVLTEFGKDTVPALQSSLKSKLSQKASKYGTRRNSSSDLANSIKFSFNNSTTSTTFILSMADYGDAVDGGRKAAPVSEKGQKSLEDWAKKQGIAESLRKKDLETRLGRQSKSKRKIKKDLKKMPFDRAAKAISFLVARKLKKHGFDGNNFFKEVMKDGRLEQLETKLKEVIKTDIKIELSNTFK